MRAILLRVEDHRNPKVCEFNFAVLSGKNVAAFYISMYAIL